VNRFERATNDSPQKPLHSFISHARRDTEWANNVELQDSHTEVTGGSLMGNLELTREFKNTAAEVTGRSSSKWCDLIR
jgi:hypothetical protein